ncbi:MAG: pentapeptide repeat-containing protein [Nitrosomonas sp.]|nr:pentapeptide repeat-containing protein [Nitrosomonas sp.]
MSKNFAGQNLNDRSFRGQDLSGADFSGCQLKSCDFRDTDLTGVRLCWATLGVDGWRMLAQWLATVVLIFISMFLTWFLNSLFISAVNEIYKYFTVPHAEVLVEENSTLIWIGSLYAASVCLSVLAALKYRGGGRIATGYFLVITIVVSVSGVVSITRWASVPVGFAALAMTGIYLLLGWYLINRSLQFEEPMLALLRRFALAWCCWGGTQFAGATLANTDFTEANLTAARFSGAHFQQPDFTHAKNLHLAWTYATLLERKPVRMLLTECTIDDRDFSNLNLRGLSFKGLNLSSCDFYHTDLSGVDFSGCDLTDADLSEAMVLGTRFSNATMTGAIIDNWSMDKHTQFDGVICDYVFTKRNKDERNPPQGDFKPGEFSKLYQEIANTIDFIAHTPDELTALLRAIDSIKQQGGDLVIQSLERKNESVVVRTQSDESIDKAAIYAEVKAQTEKELLVLQQEKQLLLKKVEMQEQHTDTLKQLLNKAIESPKTMNDNSRHYSNITAHNSAVNLGDASTVSNHIEQVADSHLADIDKQQAHQAVDELADVSQKPEAERKSLARRSLAFLKDLKQDLSSAAELGEQYGKLLLKVAAWF